MRAITSVLPPAAYPTTTVTLREGQSVACAWAEVAANNAATASVGDNTPHRRANLHAAIDQNLDEPVILIVVRISALYAFRACSRSRVLTIWQRLSCQR
jgi:hypothetical protein